MRKSLWLMLPFMLPLLNSCSPVKSQMAGAFGKYAKVTEEEKAIFESAVKAYNPSLSLVPEKVSRQVVAGMNYDFLCCDREGKSHKVRVYSPLPGRGNPSVTRYE